MTTGSYTCVLDLLVNDLVERGLWNEKMVNDIRKAKGFLSEVEEYPKTL